MIRHSKTDQQDLIPPTETFNNSTQQENNTNFKMMAKFYDKQLMIQKLSYHENVNVEIYQSSSFHVNPQILIDEAQFSIIDLLIPLNYTMNGDIYQLHKTESLKLKFMKPQIINLFLIHIKVNKFDYQNFYDSEIDEFQVKRIKIYGIFRNSEFLLLNKQIFNRNDIIQIIILIIETFISKVQIAENIQRYIQFVKFHYVKMLIEVFDYNLLVQMIILISTQLLYIKQMISNFYNLVVL